MRIYSEFLLAGVFCSLARGQTIPPTILHVDVENFVEYQSDISDLSKFATNPNPTPAAPPRNFYTAAIVGDIVAVNGQPAKGTIIGRALTVNVRPAPPAGIGVGVADITRVSDRNQIFEILQIDGTPVGTIMCLGMGGGSPPPGQPVVVTDGANFAIVGGTGAFIGVRGQLGQAPQPAPPRRASMTEDPVNRRVYGGGKLRFVLTFSPMSRPEIVNTAAGPAVTHSSDFTVVSAAKPASAGEVLSLFATGLGPTVPTVDPGSAFPASPVAVVNSPVEVTVNGKSAEVLGAVGLPGSVGGYQVNFRLPTDAVRGAAMIRVSAAWITGAPVSIAIQ